MLWGWKISVCVCSFSCQCHSHSCGYFKFHTRSSNFFLHLWNLVQGFSSKAFILLLREGAGAGKARYPRRFLRDDETLSFRVNFAGITSRRQVHVLTSQNCTKASKSFSLFLSGLNFLLSDGFEWEYKRLSSRIWWSLAELNSCDTKD